VILRVGAESASREGSGVSLRLEDGRTVTGDHLLVAVGRKPLSEGIGLETVDVEPNEHGFVEVDDQLRVGGSDSLYAIGDLNGRVLLTHAGKYQARIAADMILGVSGGAAVADTFGTPQVVFSDPQVAAAGRTLAQAQQELGEDRVLAIDLDTNASAGASFYGHGAPGKSRFVVDRERQVLLGVCFTGPDVGEWIYGAAIAIVGEVPLPRLAHVIAPFPTRSELWLQFIEAYEKKVGHSVHNSTPVLLPNVR
jgi:pyruvate/2-oxoglutarate dehydrogenase complex dihydrolipoamide dehydrogenase (E3) component